MSGLETITKYWHWAGLAALAALIAAMAFVVPDRVSRLELEREALMAEERIQAQLLEEPNIVIDALTRPGFAPQLNQIFQQSGYAHRVLRYELYDAKGRLSFTSGHASLPLDDQLVDVTSSPAQDGAVIGLYTGVDEGAADAFRGAAGFLSISTSTSAGRSSPISTKATRRRSSPAISASLP